MRRTLIMLAFLLGLDACTDLGGPPATLVCWRWSVSRQTWVYFDVCPATEGRTIP